MTQHIPDCPQPECPMRDRTYTPEQESSRLQRLEREVTGLRGELVIARCGYDRAVKVLHGIHALLYPAPTEVHGKKYVFRPKSFYPHEVLQELSDRIRAIPNEIQDELQAATNPPAIGSKLVGQQVVAGVTKDVLALAVRARNKEFTRAQQAGEQRSEDAETLAALEAVAPLLRAPGGQGGRVDEARTDIDSPFNACMYRDHCRSMQAALSQPAEAPLAGKYGEVLTPFLYMMNRELHANSSKGDRPGWLSMDRKTVLLEIYYHLSKLQKAMKDNDTSGIREYAADVANMSMMAVDVCGLLATAEESE